MFNLLLRPIGRVFYVRLLVCLLTALPLGLSAQIPKEGLRFRVSFSREFSRQKLSGRIYLILSADLLGEPRLRFRSGQPLFILAQDVLDLEPDTPITFDSQSPAFPESLSAIPAGRYAIQAIFDRNSNDWDFAHADGNGRSLTTREDLSPGVDLDVELRISREITRAKLADLARIRYHQVESHLVGRDRGIRSHIQIAVVLPASYPADPDRRYPVQFWIPESGQGARSALSYFQNRGIYSPRHELRRDLQEFVFVLVDAHTKFGHHGFIDAPGGSPWGRAFVDEVLAFVESNYRIEADRRGRFVLGHGAGGLAALNLFINNPDDFDSVYALSPDPVDHSSFFGVNLYTHPGSNMFTDEGGKPRGFSWSNGIMIQDMRTQVASEEVLGRAGRLHAFEEMYSPRGPSGQPLPLFDRLTGQIDPLVVEAWRVKDLTLRLESMGSEVLNSLKPRLHILAVETDPFRRNEPLRRMKATLLKLGADLNIQVLKGLKLQDLETEIPQVEIQRKLSARYLHNVDNDVDPERN